MATDSAHRAVSIQRATPGRFTVANDRGGRIATGTGGDTDFTPLSCCSPPSAHAPRSTWTS